MWSVKSSWTLSKNSCKCTAKILFCAYFSSSIFVVVTSNLVASGLLLFSSVPHHSELQSAVVVLIDCVTDARNWRPNLILSFCFIFHQWIIVDTDPNHRIGFIKSSLIVVTHHWNRLTGFWQNRPDKTRRNLHLTEDSFGIYLVLWLSKLHKGFCFCLKHVQQHLA